MDTYLEKLGQKKYIYKDVHPRARMHNHLRQSDENY